MSSILIRGVINGKAGKAAALPKFSDRLALSISIGEANYSYLLVEPLTCHGMRGSAKISADAIVQTSSLAVKHNDLLFEISSINFSPVRKRLSSHN